MGVARPAAGRRRGAGRTPGQFGRDVTGVHRSGYDSKGNINSKGERIYHVPGGRSYANTVIDPTHGERWFCSEAEAQAAGWRRAMQ
jgi:hypothetical protein